MLYSAQQPAEAAMPDLACKHKRTRVIAKDDDSQNIECLECGEILEVDELPSGEGVSESLSDA